jgi:hypothetical protein
MNAVCPKYAMKATGIDMSRWPFDTPWIMGQLRKFGLAVVNAASGNNAQIVDGTGRTWMDRALRAEAHLRDSIAAAESALRAAYNQGYEDGHKNKN